MLTTTTRALAAALLILAAASAAFADGIQWHAFQEGMARGKFEKKKVFLHFYADWCTYCKQMEKVTFRNPQVIEALNRDFVPIRVDTDVHTDTAAMFRVRGLPDTWFFDEQGEVIGHRPGYISAEQMLTLLEVVGRHSAEKP